MIREDAGVLRLEGAVTHGNARALLAEGRRLLGSRDLTVDLAGVAEADSCVMALLLDWRRACAAAGRPLRVTNAPPMVRALAQVYGVDALLLVDG
jgi:phospholipid transport system transporter-binding protein